METAILDILTDQRRFYRPLPILTAGQLDLLNRTWEWDDEITGLPIFPTPVTNPSHWIRLVPVSYELSSFGRTGNGDYFMEQMRTNRQTFTVPCEGNEKRALLCAILQADLKKIVVEDLWGFVRITKVDTDLIPFEHPPQFPLVYPFGKLRSCLPGSNLMKRCEVLVNEINLNAARAKLGAGTHDCRQSICKIGDLMSQQQVVRYGPEPHQVVTPLKRFRCDSNCVTYLLFCLACLRNGLCTTYVGICARTSGSASRNQSNNLHSRIGSHVTQLSCSNLQSIYGGDRASILATAYGMLVLGEPDPHQLLRDPMTHFNVVHRPEDRRYVILDGNYPQLNIHKAHELFLIDHFGHFGYDPITNSGSLNHPPQSQQI